MLTFKLILKLAKDTISKSSIVFKVFLEKVFKPFLYHQIFNFKVTFMLVSL